MPYCTDDNLHEGSYQSMGRYGGFSKQYLGLRVFDAQVVSLLSAEFLARKDIKHAPHVEGSMTL